MRRTVRPRFVCPLPPLEPLEQRSLMAAAGGFTAAGLAGEYFANANLAGPAAFARADVRLDFNWGNQAPGGSTSPAYRAVGADNFSARWTGQFVPRFSETYTFRAAADDGVRVSLRPAGAANWTKVIDTWTPTAQPVTAAAYPLTAGATYDILVEYRELTGAAGLRLTWASPSVPEEVIEPLRSNGYSVDGRGQFMFADAMKTARPAWEANYGGTTPGTDAAGWPTGDGRVVVWEGTPDTFYGGVYNVRFVGRADVSAFPGNVGFRRVGDAVFAGNTLTAAQIYNPATNTSEFQIHVPAGEYNSPFYLQVKNTRRLPTDAAPTGVTNVEIMRPRTIGGADPYPYGTLFTDTFKQAAGVFTSFRWLDVNGHLTEREWADRTKPSFGRAANPNTADVARKLWTYEYQIQFANEAGKDLYLTVPVGASDDYFRKLAQLVKNGSRADGTPASGPDDPLRVYPGLNPNLKVYVELSNEVWNGAGAFDQTRQADDAAVAAGLAPAGTPQRAEWNVMNYDGALNTSDPSGFWSYDFKRFGRWYALRTVRMSEQFRGAFGDQMGDRARVLLYWQYNNANGTALNALKFLDDYFNNGDGVNHVPTPRPVSHYLWGAGGASYYGSGNPQGRLETNPVQNPSFDATGGASPTAATARPGGATGWAFGGAAGVIGWAGGAALAADGRTLGATLPPLTGSHSAYVMRGGRLSTQITFTQSGRYAIGFTAAGSHELPLDFTIDGVRVTPQYRPFTGVGEADPAAGPTPIGYSWNTNLTWWQTDLTTATFEISVPAGGSKTVTFEVSAADVSARPWDGDYAAQLSQTVLFDEFYLASVDRLFDAGLPDAGQALGQVSTGAWGHDLAQTAQYAQAYGLKPASYESGWSVGGDDGASPLQNWAKYRDPRAKLANTTAVETLAAAGYGLVEYGVYEQWRDYRPQDAAASPLRQSFAETNDRLPAEPTNGLPLPLTLTAANQTLGYAGAGTNWNFTRSADATLSAGEWLTWNVLAPVSGNYSLTLRTAAGGTVRLTLDETTVLATGPSGTALTGTAFLTKGLHTVKVRATAGTVGVQAVDVARPGAPAAPALGSAVEGDGSVSLTWAAVPGATGYKVRWGTVPGVYTSATAVGAVTNYRVAGLANGTTYYFAVGAENASGEGLPSNPMGVAPLADGQVGNIGRWGFAGYTGMEATAPPLATSGRAAAGAVTRGPGLTAGSDSLAQWFPGRLSSGSAAPGAAWATSVADADARGQYYQFTVTPASGRRLSLAGLSFRGWFQHPAGAQVGVQWSRDGATYSPLAVTGGPNDPAGYAVDLSTVAAAQNLSAPVTFRIYLYGVAAYTGVGLGLGGGDADVVLRGSTRPGGVVGGSTGAPAASGSAAFAGTDATTRGAWRGKYGTDGYALAGNVPGTVALPAYATLTGSRHADHVWAARTTDPRALANPADPAANLAGCWYNPVPGGFDLNVRIADGAAHRVTLYLLDYDRNGRGQTVQVLDPATGAVLDTRAVADLSGGVYLTWAVSGAVTFRVTNTAGPNAVVSAMFFDGPSAAAFRGSDATTGGAWRGKYGTDGYALAGLAPALPGYAGLSAQGATGHVWNPASADPRVAQNPADANARVAACWYNPVPGGFDLRVSVGTTTRQVTLYLLDYDRGGRGQTVQVLDPATGAVLDTRAVADLSGGVYLTWAVSGAVTFRVTSTAGPNAVVSAVFFDSAARVTFAGADPATGGAWRGRYGAAGYALAGGPATLPTGGRVTPAAGTLQHTWAAATADPRGLANPATGTGLAACWYAAPAISVDVDPGAARRVTAYLVDWDGIATGAPRAARVEVLDPATGAVLDGRVVLSFAGGTYLSWDVTGPVRLRVTAISGHNAVLSGVFFD